MSEINKIPTWFWIVAVISLLWNAMGVMQFFQTMLMGSDDLAKFTAEQQQHYKDTPLWAHAAFGFATIGGLLGALLLLMRKKMALVVFIVSLVAVLLQMVNAFVLMNGMEAFGPGGLSMPIMIVAFSIFMIWFCKFSIKKAWLN